MRERAQQSWPALSKTAYGAERGGLLQVGVGEDDVGRLAAELERDALDRRGGARHDPLPDLGRAGEADLGDVRMLDEPLADDRSLADDDVQDAFRDAGLERELAEAGPSSAASARPA